MQVIDLKKYIYKNQKIEYILNDLGCKNIIFHPKKNYWSCSNPDGDNVGAINVINNEYLNVKNYTRIGYDEKSDLITLIINTNKRLKNEKYDFINAIKYLHNLLGLKLTYEQKPIQKVSNKDSILSVFTKVKRCNKQDVNNINYIDESLLDDYEQLLHINWVREGIMPWTAKKFGILYSFRRSRIIIPYRYWLNGKLIGYTMRTTLENYKELGIRKYLIKEGCDKQVNLYGLWENKQSIAESPYIVVVEAEKSVLKRDSLLDGTCVALSGHELSDEQIRILIGLDKEIIICFDKDININEVRQACENFYNIRKVSYMYDKWGIIGDNDSPCDAQDKIYKFMLQFRVIYDEKEHKEYLRSLNNK